MNTIINMKTGDLAWLPSQTALLSFADPDDPKSDVREWCYPKEPKHVLVLKDLDETYYLKVRRVFAARSVCQSRACRVYA